MMHRFLMPYEWYGFEEVRGNVLQKFSLYIRKLLNIIRLCIPSNLALASG